MPPSLNLSSNAVSSSLSIVDGYLSNMSYSINVSWCRVSKTNETTAKVSVDKNNGFEHKAIITFKSDSETVKVNVTQKSAFDHRGMITPYKQITTSSCAATGAGMCV